MGTYYVSVKHIKSTKNKKKIENRTSICSIYWYFISKHKCLVIIIHYFIKTKHMGTLMWNMKFEYETLDISL